MLSSTLSALGRIRVTLAYAVAVTAVTSTLSSWGPLTADRVIRHASTNLHNLSHGHIGTLLGSAFIVDAGPLYAWLPGLICLMALAEVLWGSRGIVVAFVVGHVGATLLVAVGLVAAVEAGWLPMSVTRATDVGMSYGAAAVLGTLAAAIPSRWRPMWIGWWLAVGAAVVILGRDFTDVGHAVALGLGMLVSLRLGLPAPWTPWRVTVLVPASAFGFLVLANTGPAAVLAAVCGAVGAGVGEAAKRLGRIGRPSRITPGDGPAKDVGMSLGETICVAVEAETTTNR
jgi:hypothetical protein